MTRELAHTHRSRVRVQQADGRDAHELVDQDLLADNGLGARHLARRSRCPRPRARPPGPPSHLGRVRTLTLTPGYLKSHARPAGIRTRLGVWLAASASSPPCLARSVGPAPIACSRESPASARRARQRCFPAAVNLLPRPFRITSLLPDRRLQRPKVHRCRWLTDRTPLGGGRDRAGPVNLQQNPQPEGMDILPLRVVQAPPPLTAVSLGGVAAAPQRSVSASIGVAGPSGTRDGRPPDPTTRAQRCTIHDLAILRSHGAPGAYLFHLLAEARGAPPEPYWRLPRRRAAQHDDKPARPRPGTPVREQNAEIERPDRVAPFIRAPNAASASASSPCS